MAISEPLNHEIDLGSDDRLQSDERLARLQAALSGIAQIRQNFTPETDSEECMAIDVDKATRLEAALSTINDNYLELDQVVVTGNDLGDPVPELRLNDVQAAMVVENLYLTVIYARKFRNKGEPIEDLEQVAAMALIKSAINFDPDFGVLFKTFASRGIEGELKRHFRDKAWSVKPPRHVQEAGINILKTEEELTHSYHRRPTVAEIAVELEVDEQTVSEAMVASQGYTAASIDAPSSDDSGYKSFAEDYVKQDGDTYIDADNKLLVEELLARLEPHEATTMRARAGLDPFKREHSQEEVSEILGVSQSYASRIETRALTKLAEFIDKADALY